MYLTLLAIIQGVALAALFAKIDSLLDRHRFHAPELLMAITIFLTIVALWYEYQMGVMFYNWTAELFDAFIPFMFGVFEFAMIIGVERGVSTFLAVFGLAFVVAIVGFEYQYMQVRRAAGSDPLILHLTRGFRATDFVSCFASLVLLLGASALVAHSQSNGSLDIAAASLAQIIAVVHFVREGYQSSVLYRRLAEAS